MHSEKHQQMLFVGVQIQNKNAHGINIIELQGGNSVAIHKFKT